MSTCVTVTRDGPVMHVRLARPEKLNAFSAELVEQVTDAIAAAAEEDTRLVVFRGEGKGFSGGFDLDGLATMTDGDLVLRFIRVEELLQAVYHAPFATLALAHGPCYGAAADLFAACQWRIAAPEARFRMPGLRFGIVLGTNRLSHLVGADRARTLLLRDAPFDAAEAVDSGFAQRIVPQDDWDTVVSATLHQTVGLDQSTFGAMASRVVRDTRADDMDALVRSAASGSIKQRIETYLEEVRQARKAAS